MSKEVSTRAKQGSTFMGFAIGRLHVMSVVKMVHPKNKPRGVQLTKALLPPPPWRSLVFLAGSESQTHGWHCHWKGMLTM